MVHIDHESFPHIIDLILEYAPAGSLLAFRPTSRAFLIKADSLIFRHIVVLPLQDSEVKHLSISDQCRAPVRLSGFNGPLPGKPYLSASPAQRREWCTRLRRYCKVVDYHRPVQYVYEFQRDDPDPTVLLLSTLSEASVSRIPTTIYNCSEASRRSSVDFVLLTPSEYGWGTSPMATVADFQRGTEIAVLSVQYNPAYPFILDSSIIRHDWGPDGNLRQIVMIFTETRHAIPHPTGDTPTPLTAWGMLSSLPTIIRFLPTVPLAIVGFEAIERRLLNVCEDVCDGDLYEAFQLATEEMIPGAPKGNPHAIEFLSKDEYRMRVGDEQFELQTACPASVLASVGPWEERAAALAAQLNKT